MAVTPSDRRTSHPVLRRMFGRMRMPRVTLSPAYRGLPWIVSAIGFAIVTIILLTQRGRLDKAHIVLLYLIVILGGSAWGGRVLGIILSILAFLVFDWAFLPPYSTLIVRDPLDWLVLLAFLITSLVAAQLLHAAKAERAATERAEMLREVDRLKDALLASVSHDLRTPLTTIKGLAGELREGHDTIASASVYEHAVLIEEQTDRLNRLVTDLLDVARLDSGNIPLNISINAAEDVLGALENQFAGRADRNRLKLSVDGADILLGRFDFVHTLRILTNLTDNALKYAPVDTPVEIRAFARGDRLVFEVADRGPGIPPQLRNRLFEPLTRAERGNPESGSAGLGLSIAKRLVDLQHGTITYLQRPDGGTIFTFDFPGVSSEMANSAISTEIR